jgi:hypothetical protein
LNSERKKEDPFRYAIRGNKLNNQEPYKTRNQVSSGIEMFKEAKSTKKHLKCWYTNATSLNNKIELLNVYI